MRVLAGDIGGTHARLLLSELNENSRQDIAESTYISSDFNNVTE